MSPTRVCFDYARARACHMEPHWHQLVLCPACCAQVTRITTGNDPAGHEEVYGARATDNVFGEG
jgi:hypothetical protein